MTTYLRSWIAHGGSVAYSAPFPDLNPLDFFFCGHLKSLVYETPAVTEEDLIARHMVASADVASTPELFKRVQKSFVCYCRLGYDLRDRIFE
ncbi:uncharacterized protein TNCV_142571 [Trichonephila clavipes]|nr:uncharacterized protein TNCV_142571 [Trichonephila clavipes]